ncbi:putative DNA topoisomerase II [Babesia divergens]|uniref:DNA topoisomerase 2 n=1 Tax=Babesia divergens TaxID=32595 RepID=A0AAD9LEB3_BABDI|nr:putative DNA topoisomerase II [Babesia divergens]
MASQKKTIEQRYQKKSQLEHILLRPDTYIGNTEMLTQQMWVYNTEKKRMVYESVSFIPGLYKIFDEVLVNAADVHARQQLDPSLIRMTCIKVSFNQETGAITVFNDGEPIPVQIHKELNMYVPQMLFGELLTSDNYDDSEGRVTGGRNGFGAKLTNIFSKSFSVTCGDSRRRKQFTMKWEDNMTKIHTPAKVTPYHGKDFVKITFLPDYTRFAIDAMDEGTLRVLMKRVYDVAGTTGLKVYWNDERLPVSDFKQYTSLFFEEDAETSMVKVYDKVHRWEVMVSATDGSGFQQVSFVNNITTLKGGTHVQHVLDPLVTAVINKVKSKNKDGVELKPYQVKNYIFLFVNCQIVNPSFDSQTKETLTTKIAKFETKYTMSPKAVAAILKSTLMERIISFAQGRLNIELKKKMKVTKAVNRLTGIPKLEDASRAGTRHARDCTLILTEGDSAKTSCLAGLSVVGRDNYGVFPLKGKLLNVREAGYKQLVQNAEIQNILKIMGLDISKKEQTTPDGLRYGSIMIMTDQDYDGSHIKGLLINLLHYFWPKMIRYRGFVREFVTPIIKATKGDAVKSFFTIQDYMEWVRTNSTAGWKIKYYKGLGTSTDKEFKEYFSNIQQHLIDFIYEDNGDDDSIDMAFNKKRVDDRKVWMQSYEHGTTVDHSIKSLRYADFINKELIQFSIYDTERSIPSVVDGWKPGQRKVLFGCLKRNLVAECKVAQLTGYVAEHSAYHHGEASLQQTIINMAQDFVGSNNINVLEPCGQFGSRKEGGKDASAARYIFTRLMAITRLIFIEDDDNILQYQNEEGQIIEPFYYIPIIPMVLVNGSEGIGTGFSSQIPNYNPYNIISNLKLYLNNEEMKPMVPWYRKFTGRIEPNDKGGFDCIGVYRWLDEPGLLEITELPVRRWTHDYKVFLESLEQGSGRKEPLVLGFVDNSTHENIHFTVNVNPDYVDEVIHEGVDKVFKLRTSIATSNMTLFDGEKKLKRYSNELEIIRDFAEVRLHTYDKRRMFMIENLRLILKKISNQVRFIHMVINEELVLFKKRRSDLIAELVALKFDPQSELVRPNDDVATQVLVTQSEPFSPTNTQRRSATMDAMSNDYNYLLSMSLWSLTHEQVQKLNEERRQKELQLQKLMETTAKDMWLDELERLEDALKTAYQQPDPTSPSLSLASLNQLVKRKRKTASRQKTGATPMALESPMVGGSNVSSSKSYKRAKAKESSSEHDESDDVLSLVSDTYTDDEPEYSGDEMKSTQRSRPAKKQMSITAAFANAGKTITPSTAVRGRRGVTPTVQTDAALPTPTSVQAETPVVSALDSRGKTPSSTRRGTGSIRDMMQLDTDTDAMVDSVSRSQVSEIPLSQDALCAADIERVMQEARRKNKLQGKRTTKSTPTAAVSKAKRTPQRASRSSKKYESSEEEDYYGEDDDEESAESEASADEDFGMTIDLSRLRSHESDSDGSTKGLRGSQSGSNTRHRTTTQARGGNKQSDPVTPAKAQGNDGTLKRGSATPASKKGVDKSSGEHAEDSEVNAHQTSQEQVKADSITNTPRKRIMALETTELRKFSIGLAERLRQMSPQQPHK